MVKPRASIAPASALRSIFRPAAGAEPAATAVGILLTGLPEFAIVSAGRVTAEGDGIPTDVDPGTSGFVPTWAGERTRVFVEEAGGDVRMIDVTLVGGPPRALDYADMRLVQSGGEPVEFKADARVFFVGFEGKVPELSIDDERVPIAASASNPAPAVVLESGPHALEVEIDGIRRRLTVDLDPGELLDLTRAAFVRAPAVETPVDPPVGPVVSASPSPSPSASPGPSSSPQPRVMGDARVIPSPASARVTIGGVEVAGPTFLRTLAPGRYPVQVSAEGYETLSAMIDVRSGVVSELRVELVRTPTRSRAPAIVLGLFAAVGLLSAAAAAVGASRADKSDPSTEW